MHCLVYGKHNKQSYTTTGPPEEYETPIRTTVLEMNTNTAYGQIQYKPNEPLTTTTSGTAVYGYCYYNTTESLLYCMSQILFVS